MMMMQMKNCQFVNLKILMNINKKFANVLHYAYMYAFESRNLTAIFLLTCVWTLPKEWSIYHHYVMFIVILLPEIVCT